MKPFSPTPQITFLQKIEMPFVPQPEAHFLVNDLAKKLNDEKELEERDKDIIRDLFIELQNDENRTLVDSLIFLKNDGIMTPVELGIIGSYFMTARTLGPNSALIEDNFIKREIPHEEFDNIVIEVSIPEFVKNILMEVYKRIPDTTKTEDDHAN